MCDETSLIKEAAEKLQVNPEQIKEVHYVELLPLAKGVCADCGIEIEFLCVMLCEGCMEQRLEKEVIVED